MNGTKQTDTNIVQDLQERLSALEQQYSGFVRYCIEMIQFHTSLIKKELKNDLNTPRDLLKLVQLHGDNLEKSVKLASNGLKTFIEKIPEFSLQGFRNEIELIMQLPYSESEKVETLDLLFSDLYSFISDLIGKSEIKGKNSQQATKKTEKNWIDFTRHDLIRGNDKEKALKSKVKKLEKDSEEKEKQVLIVVKQLERIKEMQENSIKSIKSVHNAHSEKFLYKSQKEEGIDHKSVDSQARFQEVIMKKLAFLEKLVKQLAAQAADFHRINENQEIGVFFNDFKERTEKIEKVLDEIVTPRFEEESEASYKSLFVSKEDGKQSELEMKRPRGNSHVPKAKHEELQTGTNLGISSPQSSLKRLSGANLNKARKALKVCRESSIELKVTYQNENLIRALRKQLKEKEKECTEKDSFISNLYSDLNRKHLDAKSHKLKLNLDKLQLQPESLDYKRNLSLSPKSSLGFKSGPQLSADKLLETSNQKLQYLEKENKDLKALHDGNLKVLKYKEEQIRLLTQFKSKEKVRDCGLGLDFRKVEGLLGGILVGFETKVRNEFENVEDSVEIKFNYLERVLLKAQNARLRIKEMVAAGRESKSCDPGDKEKDKMIDSLDKSFISAKKRIVAMEKEIVQCNKEKKDVYDIYEKKMIEISQKNQEIDRLRHKNDERFIKKIQEHDQTVNKLTEILHKYELQESVLSKRIQSQSELIESLSANYENAKSALNSYKSENLSSKSRQVQLLESENARLASKLMELETYLLDSHNLISCPNSPYLKNLYQSQLSILNKQYKELDSSAKQSKQEPAP